MLEVNASQTGATEVQLVQKMFCKLPGGFARQFCALWILGTLIGLAGCGQKQSAPVTQNRISSDASTQSSDDEVSPTAPGADDLMVPDWAVGAVFYQVFPERFRNGDSSNDPTRESLEFPENVTDKWRISPWTGDWYARDEWERERGDNYYEQGVFDRRYGGDLQGVLDKIDYLHGLGVTALYLNPVFYACSLHKYDGNTFHHIDPYFGPDPTGDLAMMATETSDPETWKWTTADSLFLELVKQVHERDMRIVIDGVFNHTGRDFFAFADLVENQAESPYRDWYIVQRFDNPSTPQNEFAYKGWWGVDTLPEFADNAARDDLHPGPKAYVFDATRRWMDPNGDGDPGDGIDGWRLDVAVEVPSSFWRSWHQMVREVNPNVYTVAEHWEDAAGYLRECHFSATMNYHGFAFPVKGYLIDGVLAPSDAARLLTERSEAFDAGRRHGLLSLIDSHDTDRVASMIVNRPAGRPYLQPDRFDYDVGERVSPRNWPEYDVRKPNEEERRIQRMVALMQVTFIGAPMIYYGTEMGMWGADDPCDRMPMVWKDLGDYADQSAHPQGKPRTPDAVEADTELWKFYQSVIWLRKQLDALRTGSFEVVYHNDEAQALAFKRSGKHSVYALFNRGEKPHTFEIDAPEGQYLESFTASGEPEHVKLKRQDGKLRVSMPGLEAAVVLHRSDIPNSAEEEE